MNSSFINRISLRNRIFISILLISLVSSVLVGVLLSIQYSNQAKEYHKERFYQREKAFLEHLNFIISNTPLALNEKTLPLVLKNKIAELSTIHDVQVDVYNLKGKLILSSRNKFIVDKSSWSDIPSKILQNIQQTIDKRWVIDYDLDDVTYQTTYHYISDAQGKNIGIVSLPYVAKDNLYKKQMNEFLISFGKLFLFLIALSILVAFLLSRTITSTLQRLTNKIIKTRINQQNEKLHTEGVSREVRTLIMAYNRMVDELEESAQKLAKSERETAWREMARQVAHEIKNPLTPMRLTIQMFQQTFDPTDPNAQVELNEFSETLIQQIDTMSAVASAFSNFASMPTAEKKYLDIIPTARRAIEIFKKEFVLFEHKKEKIEGYFDTVQITRILTNLVKNAIQATKGVPKPAVKLFIDEEDEQLVMKVVDNGVGIPKENIERIFEPKFTTKTKGMGLGLAMIKNIIENNRGTIEVSSQPNNTQFIVKLPKK